MANWTFTNNTTTITVTRDALSFEVSKFAQIAMAVTEPVLYFYYSFNQPQLASLQIPTPRGATLNTRTWEIDFSDVSSPVEANATDLMNTILGWLTSFGGGTGTVTDISIASDNGFAGVSDGDPATPELTISTTVIGMVKGDGTALSAAAAGTDYLAPNAPIVAATKTKITYDTDGLVTAGADATTADIAASTNKNYVTDAELVVIGNTSGTNTGDQTTLYSGNGSLSANRTVTMGGNYLSLDGGASAARFILDADNNIGRILSFRTDNSPRWALRVDGNETGSNAGADFVIRRYNDAGTFVDSPLSIVRSTGNATFSGTLAASNLSGTNTGDQTSVTGNAGTATALQTGRTIGGVTFDGTSNIVPQTIESANEATDTTCFLLFVTGSGTQQLQPKNNTSLIFNSNTGALAATLFSADTITANTNVVPDADDGAGLGTTSLKFSDLFLASGAVINFNSGNATLTHSAALITSNVNIAVPDEAYGSSWNGSLNVPTKNAIFDAMNSTAGVANCPTSTSTQTVTHGLGRTPTRIRIHGMGRFTSNAAATPTPSSHGVWCSSGNACVYMTTAGTTTQDGLSSSTFAVFIATSSGNTMSGIIQNVGATTFDIAWTETGTAAALPFMWEAE